MTWVAIIGIGWLLAALGLALLLGRGIALADRAEAAAAWTDEVELFLRARSRDGFVDGSRTPSA